MAMTILTLFIIIIMFVSPVKLSIYLFNTEDSSAVDMFDCIHHEATRYCRRPMAPIDLKRNHRREECYHNGTMHTFRALRSNNISVSVILHQWGSSIEKVEEYARYMRQINQSTDDDKNTLCQCTNHRSFGKNCDYILPIEDQRFEATLDWEIYLRSSYPDYYQHYSDILCYITLQCDSGRLCLDWRDICDGVQQCTYGHDEETCDLLEFHECENDEYRCRNGMCIPEEYFLDGDYDCLDLSDEKQLFNDVDCTYQQTNPVCDDRVCLPNQWSCGDGQCIDNRLAFQQLTLGPHACTSRRDQYYMCETNFLFKQWTMSNGKCDRSREYIEKNLATFNHTERCLYYLKCQLTEGFEKNCPCDDTWSCRKYTAMYCLETIQYPVDRVITSYATSLFIDIYNLYVRSPDILVFNATIKCRGFLIKRSMLLSYTSEFDLRRFELQLCNYSTFGDMLLNAGYDRDCHRGSFTVNDRPYHFLDVCQHSAECISGYRIQDGIRDCADGMDEKSSVVNVTKACFNVQQYRFRCSADEPTCLFVNKLGDGQFDCQNKRDESWMSTNVALSEMICNHQSKKDCTFLRQYVQQSWNSDFQSDSSDGSSTMKLPFRRFCDTFYDLGSKEDEDSNTCQKWWLCPTDQWQCHTGQCIDVEWVLDGEWDCGDASDEEALFIYNHTFLAHNLKLINVSYLMNKFNKLYKTGAFYNICDFTKEYPCFRVNIAQQLINITHHRPCINLRQIGDGHIDCIGGIDERNTLRHCTNPTTLGRDFMCISTRTCIDEFDLCKTQCSNRLDDHVLCYNETLKLDCLKPRDALCINGQCMSNEKCNGHPRCTYGEDEYMCDRNEKIFTDITKVIYRMEKEQRIKRRVHQLQTFYLPVPSNGTEKSNVSSLLARNRSFSTNTSISFKAPLPYTCNRGVGVLSYRNLTVCLCPPQYYGSKCEFHSDRLTVILHVNLSQSIYREFIDSKCILKVLVLFLFENQTLTADEFHVAPAIENLNYKKWMTHFLYSRSNQSIEHKRKRYFNRSNIINEHPYALRIEAYELVVNKKPKLITIWQYRIYFDFLPSFRLAKILRLSKPTMGIDNPCLKNPCAPHQQCHQLENAKSSYICLCSDDYRGTTCSTLDPLCGSDYCSPHAICKAAYRDLLSSYEKPYCICPLNKFGRRCELEADICLKNMCQNNGTCYPSVGDPQEFLCICDMIHYGRLCEQKKQVIQMHSNGSIQHSGATVQYFRLNLITFDLMLLYQRVFITLPEKLIDLLGDNTVPDTIVFRFYLDSLVKIYLIIPQADSESIDQTIQWHEQPECMSVYTLWPNTQSKISPIQYHYLCLNRSNLACFYDNDYMCICTNETSIRAECFAYDHHLDQCSRCLAGARCVQADQTRRNDFICVCPPCYYGSLCQLNSATQSLSLDSLFVKINANSQLIYLILSILIFVIGGMNNYASFVTFKHPNLRRLGIARCLLVSSLVSQLSLLTLFGKTMQNVYPSSILNTISCKILSYLLSSSTRCSFWLISWVTLERLSLVLFPFNNILKKPLLTSTILVTILITVSLMHVHELIFYIPLEDSNGQLLCAADFTRLWSIYNRATLTANYIIPFAIQFIAISLLIVFTTRSRSRTRHERKTTFIELLRIQFNNQKELYIVPLIIIISSLPQVILSFVFSCTELSLWQRHTLLVAYFLSYAPQLLGFILFVSPSKTFLKEFQQTQLGKRYLCQLLYQKKK